MRWTAIDEGVGLYELEKKVKSGWAWRSLAVRLEDRGYLIVSPIRGTASALDELGEAHAALAPNHFHYMGIAELLERRAELAVSASDVAGRRLTKKLGRAVSGLDPVRERLPRGVTILEPPALKTGEVWLRAETERGVAWIVSDAFFNVEGPLRGAMGLALKMTSTAPGLRVGDSFRWFAVGDRRAYRGWLEAQLRDDPPRLLIPSHGAIAEGDDLADRLAALTSRL